MLLRKPMKNWSEFRNTSFHKVLYEQTVGDVIETFSLTGAHALFVVDKEGMPVIFQSFTHKTF